MGTWCFSFDLFTSLDCNVCDSKEYGILFIEDLDSLCEKYGLVHAPARFFKEDIPEMCLQEIEKFTLWNEDIVFENTDAFTEKEFNNVTQPIYFGGDYLKDLSEQEVEKLKDGEIVNYDYNTKMYVGPIRKTGFDVIGKEEMFDAPAGFEFSNGSLKPSPAPDPIVIQRVMEGFLVISAWGEEAELPEINIQKQ